jgi:aminoglycoside phosphotransferase
MKLTSIERKLATLEAEVHALSSRRKPMLQAIVDDRDPTKSLEQEQARALAEHVAAHPEHAGLTVGDFDWSLWTVVYPRPNSQ